MRACQLTSLDLAGLETLGAHVHFARTTADHYRHLLDVRSKHPWGDPMGMAHVAARLGLLAADATYL